MYKMTFRHESAYDGQPTRSVEVVTDAATLEEILVDFAQFLRGCGFEIPVEGLEVVDE